MPGTKSVRHAERLVLCIHGTNTEQCVPLNAANKSDIVVGGMRYALELPFPLRLCDVGISGNMYSMYYLYKWK